MLSILYKNLYCALLCYQTSNSDIFTNLTLSLISFLLTLLTIIMSFEVRLIEIVGCIKINYCTYFLIWISVAYLVFQDQKSIFCISALKRWLQCTEDLTLVKCLEGHWLIYRLICLRVKPSQWHVSLYICVCVAGWLAALRLTILNNAFSQTMKLRCKAYLWSLTFAILMGSYVCLEGEKGPCIS